MTETRIVTYTTEKYHDLMAVISHLEDALRELQRKKPSKKRMENHVLWAYKLAMQHGAEFCFDKKEEGDD